MSATSLKHKWIQPWANSNTSGGNFTIGKISLSAHTFRVEDLNFQPLTYPAKYFWDISSVFWMVTLTPKNRERRNLFFFFTLQWIFHFLAFSDSFWIITHSYSQGCFSLKTTSPFMMLVWPSSVVEARLSFTSSPKEGEADGTWDEGHTRKLYREAYESEEPPLCSKNSENPKEVVTHYMSSSNI